MFTLLLYWIFLHSNKFIQTTSVCLLLQNKKNHASNLLKKYGPGSYVIITGASDGIGRSFSGYFASLGFNLILWARNKNKLESVKKSILTLHPKLDVKLIIDDFVHSTSKNFFAKNLQSLEDTDLSVLINNVGVNYPDIQFHKMTTKSMTSIVNINMIPQAALTGWALEKFT